MAGSETFGANVVGKTLRALLNPSTPRVAAVAIRCAGALFATGKWSFSSLYRFLKVDAEAPKDILIAQACTLYDCCELDPESAVTAIAEIQALLPLLPKVALRCLRALIEQESMDRRKASAYLMSKFPLDLNEFEEGVEIQGWKNGPAATLLRNADRPAAWKCIPDVDEVVGVGKTFENDESFYAFWKTITHADTVSIAGEKVLAPLLQRDRDNLGRRLLSDTSGTDPFTRRAQAVFQSRDTTGAAVAVLRLFPSAFEKDRFLRQAIDLCMEGPRPSEHVFLQLMLPKAFKLFINKYLRDGGNAKELVTHFSTPLTTADGNANACFLLSAIGRAAPPVAEKVQDMLLERIQDSEIPSLVRDCAAWSLVFLLDALEYPERVAAEALDSLQGSRPLADAARGYFYQQCRRDVPTELLEKDSLCAQIGLAWHPASALAAETSKFEAADINLMRRAYRHRRYGEPFRTEKALRIDMLCALECAGVSLLPGEEQGDVHLALQTLELAGNDSLRTLGAGLLLSHLKSTKPVAQIPASLLRTVLEDLVELPAQHQNAALDALCTLPMALPNLGLGKMLKQMKTKSKALISFAKVHAASDQSIYSWWVDAPTSTTGYYSALGEMAKQFPKPPLRRWAERCIDARVKLDFVAAFRQVKGSYVAAKVATDLIADKPGVFGPGSRALIDLWSSWSEEASTEVFNAFPSVVRAVWCAKFGRWTMFTLPDGDYLCPLFLILTAGLLQDAPLETIVGAVTPSENADQMMALVGYFTHYRIEAMHFFSLYFPHISAYFADETPFEDEDPPGPVCTDLANDLIERAVKLNISPSTTSVPAS